MKPIQFRTRDEAQEKAIDKFMNEKGLNQTDAMIKIIDKFFDMENQFAPLDDPCPLLFYLGESEAPPKVGKGWYCLKKSPNEKLLGSGILEAAAKYCKACQIRDEALEDSKTLREQRNKGLKVLLHSCKKGAKTNEDMTEMHCPEIGRWRPIMTRKKKTDYVPCRDRGTNNARCIYLVSTQTTIKGDLPEDGKNL